MLPLTAAVGAVRCGSSNRVRTAEVLTRGGRHVISRHQLRRSAAADVIHSRLCGQLLATRARVRHSTKTGRQRRCQAVFSSHNLGTRGPAVRPPPRHVPRVV